jgi:hypothetical protein
MKKLTINRGYSIGNTHFIVDTDKQVLREFLRPTNEISFVSDMLDKQTHYELRFNTQSGSVHEKTHPDEHLQIVEVPQMTQLDPIGMSRKYGIPEEQLKGKTDFEIIVDPEALAIRKNGKLPIIDINGERFVVDLRMHELRHAEFFYPVISLKSFDIADEDWRYEGFYNTMLKQVVEIDPNLLEFPDHVIKIRLPLEVELDPVAVARDHGIDERDLLRRYPIQKELIAEVIPLSETEVPAMIQRNKEALQKEHAENMKKTKPVQRHRPRF